MKSALSLPDVRGGGKCWLRVGELLDGFSDHPRKDVHIVYTQEGIAYVGDTPPPRDLVPQENTEPDLHLPDYTLYPGLIESHAHFFLEGNEPDLEKRKQYLTQSPAQLLQCAQQRLERLVRIGIMAVRDAGDKDGVGLSLGRLYRQGDRPLMPYVDSPGAAIHHRGRYGAFMGEPIEDFSSPEECVHARVAAGAHRIKLIPTGIINFAKGSVTAPPQMTTDELKALVSAARSLNKQTFAHASGDAGIEHAIQAGVDSIEHGYFLREDQLSTMRDTRVAWVPTFVPLQKQIDFADIMGWNDDVIASIRGILDQHAKMLYKAYQMGVVLIAGSDAGSVAVAHGYGFLDELEIMEAAGLPSIAVLNSATGVPSSRLGFHEKFGMILQDFKSRFILSRHSPALSISNLRKERVIVYDGMVLPGETEGLLTGL